MSASAAEGRQVSLLVPALELVFRRRLRHLTAPYQRTPPDDAGGRLASVQVVALRSWLV